MYINEERIIKQNVNNWRLWMRILCTILASFLSVCSMILKLLRFQTHDTLNHHEALKPYQFFIFYDWCTCAFLKVNFGGSPGGPVVKNLPCIAKDTGSIPGPGRSHMPRSNLAHVPQLLSLRTAATEAFTPSACALQQEKPLQREARALHRRVALAHHN